MNPLVLTTLPHFLALYYSPDELYTTIVMSSTSCSVLWHLSDSSATSFLGILDHTLAFLWFLTDVSYFYTTPFFTTMLLFNGLVTVTNVACPSSDYTRSHSLWHLLSSAKAIYLAYLLSTL